MKRAVVLALLLVGCAGHSTVTEPEPCPVVLANPGPNEAMGCFRVTAGNASSVRVFGDPGPGEPFVNVVFGESYEALSCVEAWGAPTLGTCSE